MPSSYNTVNLDQNHNKVNGILYSAYLIGNRFGVLCMSMSQKQLAANQYNGQRKHRIPTEEDFR